MGATMSSPGGLKKRRIKEALEKGEQDHTTVAEISVMVYYTPEYKNFASDPILHIKKQITFANLVFSISEIPVKLSIFCIEELEGFVEDPDVKKRLQDFRNAKNLPNRTNFEILMTGTRSAEGEFEYIGPPEKNFQIVWVRPENEMDFLHVLGRLFGCQGNREDYEAKEVDMDNSNFGYHMIGSNMRTIMANHNVNYFHDIPRFSSKDQTYNGVPLGDSLNDNRSQIIKTRFLLTMGPRAGNCGHHKSTCAQKCLKNCCPADRAKPENDEMYAEECRYCQEKVIIPLEDHYVIDAESSTTQNTCTNILYRRDKEALEKGEQDHTTVAKISVMVYFTPVFKTFASDPVNYIKRQIAFANLVFCNNEIPIKLYIFCIEELEGFVEHPEAGKRLDDFKEAKKNILNGADIGILMTGTPAENDGVCHGMAYGGPPSKENPPLAWVHPEDKLTFLHELGHIFGCQHNREEIEDGGANDQSNYGYHMKGSCMSTILAYENETYFCIIPRFSSKDTTYNGVPLGNLQNDNRSQIMRTRFLLSQRRNKMGNCGHHDNTCAEICLQNCCPIVQTNADNDSNVFSEVCQYCHEKIIIPFEDHYVKDSESSLKDTCKNILIKEALADVPGVWILVGGLCLMVLVSTIIHNILFAAVMQKTLADVFPPLFFLPPCSGKCFPNCCCPKDKANDEVFVEECEYCHEIVIIPFKDHYVTDAENSSPNTCKIILMRKKKEDALEKEEQKRNEKWKRVEMFGRSIMKTVNKTLNKI